jgi:hypothetical protein
VSPITAQASHGERPTLFISMTDRANALVWRMPAPRRIRVLLSQLVYRNPPMPRERALETLRALDRAGVETVLIGGWGIDALVGEELRPHGDLDLLADENQLERAVEALAGLGFEPWNHDSAPGPIGEVRVSSAQTFRDRALRVVELHAVDLGEVDAARGRIGTMRVSCLSADHQLHAQRQMGRTWTPQRRSNQRRNLAAVAGALHGDPDGA